MKTSKLIILLIISCLLQTIKPSKMDFEKKIADIPFRNYRNIENKEADTIIKFVNSESVVTMPEELWDDLIIRGRTRFAKNGDWYELVKTVFEKIDKNDLKSRRGFLIAVEKLETKNREAANDLRDYMRSADLIDIKNREQ